jgi:Xaa-Pro aminopeptidase
MKQKGFDAIVIIGESAENYPLNYLTNHASISEGIVIKKQGEEPLLIVGAMERDEAAKSGLQVQTFNDYNLYALVQETGSYFEARLRMLVQIFKAMTVRGVVSFYGLSDPGKAFVMLTELAKQIEEVTITGETETSIFDLAYAIKSDEELTAMKSVAERSNQVMKETLDFIVHHPVQGDQLLKTDNTALTIGDVKTFVRGALMAHHLEEADGMIFAIGRDAGVPHSRGDDTDIVTLGRVIIFDLFPRELGGGYFHDMTRTFCLGYAPPDVQHAYDQVRYAFDEVTKELAVGEKTSRYQQLTCDLFEEMGHPTIRDNPATQEGYVHSLGHGVGLEIHSRPRFSSVSEETIETGHVFTIEPGLYYPDRGFGVRIEDTFFVDSDGSIHSLTPFPKDLVIPVG